MAIPWKILGHAGSSDGILELRQRGPKDFQITLNGGVLMNSAANRSELALGTLGCKDLVSKAPRVVVAGLGLGFTLRAALDALPAHAKVVAAELNAAVAEWCRGPLVALTESAVLDPRVTVKVADVLDVIRRAAEDPARRFDAIVLDLHTGPHAGTRSDDPAYGTGAIAEMKRALTAKGRLSVWGEAANQPYEDRLVRAGFRVTKSRPGAGGLRHVVYVAQK